MSFSFTGSHSRKAVSLLGSLLVIGVVLGITSTVFAQDAPTIDVQLSGGGQPDQVAGTVKIVLLLGLMSFIPGLLMTVTSFTRIIIVLSFLRQAIGTHQMPPNQVLLGLALFMTLFIMTPTFIEIEKKAYSPYVKGAITTETAMEELAAPLRIFMLKQTRDKDIGLFYSVVESDKPESRLDVPMIVLIPSYVISELKTAFQMGFLIFIPFLVVDMIVASVLMAMGMMMLPPVMISLPFKILLFVMVDGWYLVVSSLLHSF